MRTKADAKRCAGLVANRTPREEIVPLALPASMDSPGTVRVPGSCGLTLHAVVRPVDAASFAGRIPPGTRSVSLFLVNERIPSADRDQDESFAFQVEIEVRSAALLRASARSPRGLRRGMG